MPVSYHKVADATAWESILEEYPEIPERSYDAFGAYYDRDGLAQEGFFFNVASVTTTLPDIFEMCRLPKPSTPSHVFQGMVP